MIYAAVERVLDYLTGLQGSFPVYVTWMETDVHRAF